VARPGVDTDGHTSEIREKPISHVDIAEVLKDFGPNQTGETESNYLDLKQRLLDRIMGEQSMPSSPAKLSCSLRRFEKKAASGFLSTVNAERRKYFSSSALKMGW